MIVALAGGVGAAKLLRGLVDVIAPDTLTIISNTGDDIELYGLHISPDIDIVAYTLSGLVDEERGWGIRGDTFECLAMLQRYGEAMWFNLGDRDLGTHILRTQRRRMGQSLTDITAAFCQALGLSVRILPMSNQPVPSLIRTPAGLFHFQEYLVQRGGQEQVLEVIYHGVEQAQPAPGVCTALTQAEAILGFEVSAYGVARYYDGLLHGLVIDTLDAALQPRLERLGLRVEVTNTIMRTLADKQALAQTMLALARKCQP